MGSVCIALPARLGHAGDVTLVGGLAQADPAEAELAVVSARATATTATVVFPALILGFTALTDLLGSLGHLYLLSSAALSSPSAALSPALSSPSGRAYASGFSSFSS